MSEQPPFSPTLALLTIGRSWDAELADELRSLGLTTRKYGLLGHVRGSPGISFSELARRSRITVQSVHTAVAGFVEAGLVEDVIGQAGSASRLEVTADGEALLSRAGELVRRLDDTFTSRHPQLADVLRVEVRRMLEGDLQID
ncbi:MarR family transcriptional regulator [Aeromicrobium sp. NPDC092404]|uniref:MarR family winged helix-turn-helix transcriptional regulator n=1 Tax=Aeromicrobium sp. NPDC092404 TaxID=3154976 RepID=UPI003434D3F8